MLNKHNLAVAALCPTDNPESRYAIHSVNVTPEYTEATDGYRLLRVTRPQGFKPEDFPQVEGVTAAKTHKPFLLPARQAAEIRKVLAVKLPARSPKIPVLDNAVIGAETDKNGHAVIATMRDFTPHVFKPKKSEGQFPKLENALPTEKPKFSICVNAADFAALLKLTASMIDSYNTPVEISFYGDDQPIKIEGQNFETGQQITAVIQPMRR